MSDQARVNTAADLIALPETAELAQRWAELEIAVRGVIRFECGVAANDIPPLLPIRDGAELQVVQVVLTRLEHVAPARLPPAVADYLATQRLLVRRYDLHGGRPAGAKPGGATTVERLLDGQGMTRTELARRSGIAISTISAVLNGRRQLTIAHVARIAGALGVEPGDILPADPPDHWRTVKARKRQAAKRQRLKRVTGRTQEPPA